MAFIFNGTDIVGAGGGATELNDLTDVSITTPTDGQALLYNSTTHKFENADGGSANIPEYTYSYWLAHRSELEATGKPFLVTNAPPSPDLTAENIGYGTSNVGAALDALNTTIVANAEPIISKYSEGSIHCRQCGNVVNVSFQIRVKNMGTSTGIINIATLPPNISKPLFPQAQPASYGAIIGSIVEIQTSGNIRINKLSTTASVQEGYIFAVITYVV